MKKIASIVTILFIIFISALPAFATSGCEEHVVNYPAEPAYTHEVGIDIYLCDVCGYEMWHCEECDQYMPIDEISCRNCERIRVAINSQEQEKINADNKKETMIAGICFFGFFIVCVIASYIMT